MQRQHVKQQRNVELGQMIRGDDVPPVGIDVFQAFDRERHGWNAQEQRWPSC